MTIYLNVFLYRQLKKQLESTRLSSKPLPGLTPFFYVENLIPKKAGVGAQWSRIGLVNGTSVQVSAIFWPGRGYKGVEKHSKRLRVAMAEAPPFIMTSPLIENTTCLLGVICIKVCLWRVYQYLGNFSYWTYIFVLGFFLSAMVLCMRVLPIQNSLLNENKIHIQFSFLLKVWWSVEGRINY